MVLDNIEKLLEKYDNGETSLKEEQELRAYFAQDNVPPHLESYRALFQYFAQTQQEQFTKEVPMQAKKRSYIYQWISVAAVILVMFGIFTQVNDDKVTTLDDLSQEEMVVYNQTKEAFNLLSTKFNQGASNVGVLGVVGNQLDKGVEQIKHVNQFSKTTNKLLKN